MADNITAGTQTGSGPILATDQRSSDSAHFPLGKLAFGPLDTFTLVSTTDGLPVQPATGAAWVLGAGSAAIGSVTVTGSVAVTNAALTAILADYNADAAIHVQAVQSGTWNVANQGTFAVQDTPTTSGGLSMSKTISASSTNATSVKGSAGQVYGVQVFNTNAAARYLKLYNKASAPTVGTDTPVKVITIPGNTAGAGAAINFDKGLAFGTGIAFALTTGAADNDTGAVAASELIVNIDYK